MKIKDLKVRFASAALSMLMVSNAGFTLSSPAYAESDSLTETELEQVLDEEEYLKKLKDEEDEEDEEELNEETYYEEPYVEGTYYEEPYVEGTYLEENNEVLNNEVIEEVINETPLEVNKVVLEETNLEEQELVEGTNLEEKELVEETNLEEQQLVEGTNLEDKELVEGTNLEEKKLVEGTVLEEKELVEGTNLEENNKDLLTDIELDPELEMKLVQAIEEEKQQQELEKAEEEGTKELVETKSLKLLSTPATEVEKTEEETKSPVGAKVAIITTKVDDEGNPLVGATLQIIDKDGNVLDEWVSDGTQHISMIPEGDYILREKSAPEGYIVAADKEFNVKIDEKEVNAGVVHDDSHDVCWHYAGVPLYFVESEGMREEVYCINQNWEEPNGTNYDGKILDETNIRTFTPDADQTMTDAELYNQVLSKLYYDTMYQQDSDVKNALSNYEHLVDELMKNTYELNSLCENVYYPDKTANSRCKNYKSIYEQVVNYFVSDIDLYNKNIDKYNEYQVSLGTLYRLRKYETNRTYIDYNQDNQYDGRED